MVGETGNRCPFWPLLTLPRSLGEGAFGVDETTPILPTPGTVGSGMLGGGAEGGPIGLMGRRDVRLFRFRTRAALGFAFVFADFVASVRWVGK